MVNSVSGLEHVLVAVDSAYGLVSVGSLCEGIHIHLLDLSYVCKLIEFNKHVSKLLSMMSAKGLIYPFCQKLHFISTYSLCFTYIPSQLGIVSHLLLKRLNGTKIGHPKLTDSLLVCLLELISRLRQRNGAKEKI